LLTYHLIFKNWKTIVTISVYASLDFLYSRHTSALARINAVQRDTALTQRKTEWKQCDAYSNILV